jgi:hypothetical protein
MLREYGQCGFLYYDFASKGGSHDTGLSGLVGFQLRFGKRVPTLLSGRDF